MKVINASDLADLGFLLTANPDSPVPKSALLTAAMSISPLAQVMLELLLEHCPERVSTETHLEVFELICLEGRSSIVEIFLDIVRNLSIGDNCGIQAIRSGNLRVLEILLQDPRLLIKNPENWIIATIELPMTSLDPSTFGNDKMFSVLKANSAFHRITTRSIDAAIKLHRRNILTQLLIMKELEDPKSSNISSDSIISYCLEHGEPETFELLLSRPRFYPSSLLQSICTSGSKKEFFQVLVRILTSKDLEKILVKCVDMNLQENIRIIHESQRVVLKAELLYSVIKGRKQSLLKFLIDSPYNVPVCTKDICMCKVAIVAREDTMARHMISKGTCTHQIECLSLCIDLALQQTGVYIAQSVTQIEPQLVVNAIYKDNIALAEAVLLKARTIDYNCLLPLIENTKLLGMLELVCSTVRLDLSWNNYAMIKLAAKQNSTIGLQYLLENARRVLNSNKS